MKLAGMIAALIDVPQQETENYNRWYDFDHLPEYAALPEIAQGRRYVATTDCKKARPEPILPELRDGRGTYFTTYLLTDPDLANAQASFRAKSLEIHRDKRMVRYGNMVSVDFYRHIHTTVRPDLPVSRAAGPYLGHQGVFVVFTRVADPSMRAEVDDWFARTHARDVLAVPGAVAALRFTRLGSATGDDWSGQQGGDGDGRYMNVYLLDGDPARFAVQLAAHSREWHERGRTFGPQTSQILFTSAYRSVVPTRYDFVTE